MTTLRIPHRFRGPSRSGNGGISAGIVATSGAFEGAAAVEVTLRAPPPLDVDLDVQTTDDGIAVRSGETVIATARTASLPDDVPAPVDAATARAAMAHYQNREHHLLPECFVCGIARDPDDGMQIHAGPVTGREIVAATWTPGPAEDDGTGQVPSALVWGALDCPSFFGLGSDAPFAVLGRLTVSVTRPPRLGEECVVIGWRRGPPDGRKHFGAAAVFGADGSRLGWSHATWVEVDPSAFVTADQG